MRNIKNLVLGLLGLVLAATLMTPGLSELSTQIDTAQINIEDDDPSVTFTLYTYYGNTDGDNDTSTVDTYKATVTATNTVGSNTYAPTVDIYVPDQQGTVTASFNAASLGITSIGEYTVTVSTLQSDGSTAVTGNVKVVVSPATDFDDELASGIIDDLDLDDDEVAPNADVEVEIALDNTFSRDFNNVHIETWIAENADGTGDRIGDKEETGEFNLRDEEEDDRTLTLNVPADTDESDYYVIVDVIMDAGVDDQLLDRASTMLTVEREKDSLSVSSAFAGTATAGQTVDFAVTTLNNGQEDEDNVRTSVTISGVGVSQTSSTYTVEEDEEVTRYFTLALPGTMTSGEYQILIRVWNDEVDETIRETLVVSGASAAPVQTPGPALSVGVDATAKTVSAATGGVYTVTLTNNGDTARTFNLAVGGTEGWADYEVNPPVVTVAPGTSGLTSIYVSPLRGATGTHAFTAYVKEGNTIVETVAMTSQITAAGVDVWGEDAISEGLRWVVTVLIIALVVLFVMWAWRREERPRTTRGRKRVYY